MTLSIILSVLLVLLIAINIRETLITIGAIVLVMSVSSMLLMASIVYGLVIIFDNTYMKVINVKHIVQKRITKWKN